MDIFDLHCDTATSAMTHSADLTDRHLDISVDECSKERYCQCFAVFVPDTIRGDDAFSYYKIARNFFFSQCEKYPGLISRVRTADEIDRTVSEGRIAGMLTVEGGAAIAGSLENLTELSADGVGMMTLTWNGENELGCGSSDQSFGLKDFGRECVRRMERMDMTVDVSHLSDRGFWDVCETTDAPFAASHSNLRKICGHRRNLTDEQFCEIVRRKGLVGINFYNAFLNDSPEEASVSDAVRHINAMLDLGGEDTVAIGSDYDGCDVVNGLKRHTDLINLYNALIGSGIDERTAEKIFWGNARRFFGKKLNGDKK